VRHARAVRRHAAGGADFEAFLVGRTIEAVHRRGKYLWFALDSGDAIMGHLGMSGQMLLLAAEAPPGPHLRVRIRFTDGGPELRFVDQRTFGGLAISIGGADLPAEIAHIARDQFDEEFDVEAAVAALRGRRSGVKRALLDQTLISGVGNIYADEALWRAKLHGARPCAALTRPKARALIGHVTDVMRAALDHGGTSFDALYVNVNGESGYFDRALAVYGREGEPCPVVPPSGEAFAPLVVLDPRCQPPAPPGLSVTAARAPGQRGGAGRPVRCRQCEAGAVGGRRLSTRRGAWRRRGPMVIRHRRQPVPAIRSPACRRRRAV
jgi:formamidopyrimidine-DNA glycosylase